MKVTVEYSAQLKRTVGHGNQEVELPPEATVQSLVNEIAARESEEVRNFLLEESGELSGSVLLFLNDEQVRWDQPTELHDGDVLTLAVPIAGGTDQSTEQRP